MGLTEPPPLVLPSTLLADSRDRLRALAVIGRAHAPVGPVSALAASIATLFYAIDPHHGLPVGWIANRNALVATALALVTLLLHDIGARRRHAGGYPFAAASALGLALCGGESAVSVVFYLASYAVFLDERSTRARIRSLVPSLGVFVFWAIAYRVGRFGAVGSGVYVDPWHAPFAYLSNLVTHGPLLLGAELGALAPDPYPLFSRAGKAVFLLAAAIVIGWAARIVQWMVVAGDARLRRTAAFFGAASVLGVLPGSSMFPSGRTILVAGFGMMALLGLVCAAPLEGARWARAPWSARTRRLVTAYAAWSWLGHAILAAPFFVLNEHQMLLLDRVLRDLSEGVPSDGSATNKRLVVMNAPDTAFVYYVIGMNIEAGRTPPTTLLTLAGNRRDLVLSRTGERTIVVHQQGGIFQPGTDLFFRSANVPMPVGTKVDLGDVTVTVAHTTDEGVPDEASFAFTKDPNTDYVFRKWEGKTLVPCTLPSVGQTFSFPGRTADLF